MIEGAGVALAVRERGAGPAALVLHAIASDAEAREDTLAELAAAGARAIAHDRRGYGASGAPEPYDATTVMEQAEDAAAVLDALGAAPAVLVGDGFGALIAIDLAMRHRAKVAGMVLADPPLLAFVAAATEALSAERSALEDALREGGPESAVDVLLDGVADPGRCARARRAHRAVFADLAGIASRPLTRRELRGIDVPAVVLSSAGAPAHLRAAADALVELLPRVRREEDDTALAAAARGLL